jgi:predicted phage terminase large subunit-like protein
MDFHEYALVASICRQSFYQFVKEFWEVIVHDPLLPNWHIPYLCNELQLIADRVTNKEEKLHDLVINIPPGSSKSTIISQMFPAWVWACRMPHAQFVCASYAEEIALKDAIRCRDIVRSVKYQKTFPHIRIRADHDKQHKFMNTKRGFRYAIGIGGAVTGDHGHFLLVDDPCNPREARSELELHAANMFMKETLPSRKIRFEKNIVPTILVQQRLHEADPSAEMMIRSEGQKIKHICIPGELTDDVKPAELREFYKNGLMDPLRLSRPVLEEMRRDMGEYGYASQVLQTPIPLAEGFFNVKKIQERPDFPRGDMIRFIRSWDKAGTPEEEAESGTAYSVGLLMGIDRYQRIWILDVVRGRWEATEREKMILETAESDGPEVEIIIEQEGGSGGKDAARATIKMLKGYRIKAYHPTGDKVARAYGFASQMGGGIVYAVKGPWWDEFISEYRHFPKSKHKDQVDAGSGAFNELWKPKRKAGGMRPIYALAA